jgi:hypothetical protein
MCVHRPSGCLVSDAAIENPEGLAFAKQACYIASAGRNAVVAVSAAGGAILESLALAEDAVPWGMTAWDPSTYPLHAAVAARHQEQPHSLARVGSRQIVSGGSWEPPAPEAFVFQAQAVRGCLFVAVQADIEKDKYYLPPKGPASGSLVCVPLLADGSMLRWQEWSRVKIKRPSGVTIDHAGVC